MLGSRNEATNDQNHFEELAQKEIIELVVKLNKKILKESMTDTAIAMPIP